MEFILSFRAPREIHSTLLGGRRLLHRTKVCQKLAGRDYKDTGQANQVGKVPEPVPLIYDAFARNGPTHQSVSPKKPLVINDYGELKTITETIALRLAQDYPIQLRLCAAVGVMGSYRAFLCWSETEYLSCWEAL